MRPMYDPLLLTFLIMFKDFILFDGLADAETTRKEKQNQHYLEARRKTFRHVCHAHVLQANDTYRSIGQKYQLVDY